MEEPRLRPFGIDDYEAALALWEASPGVELSAADERDEIAVFLARNPGLSMAADVGGELVGVALCGHDGRRGFVYHLAVAGAHRRRGLGRRLIDAALDALAADGIDKCHAFVVAAEDGARAFWPGVDWVERTELVAFSRLTPRGAGRPGN